MTSTPCWAVPRAYTTSMADPAWAKLTCPLAGMVRVQGLQGPSYVSQVPTSLASIVWALALHTTPTRRHNVSTYPFILTLLATGAVWMQRVSWFSGRKESLVQYMVVSFGCVR